MASQGPSMYPVQSGYPSMHPSMYPSGAAFPPPSTSAAPPPPFCNIINANGQMYYSSLANVAGQSMKDIGVAVGASVSAYVAGFFMCIFLIISLVLAASESSRKTVGAYVVYALCVIATIYFIYDIYTVKNALTDATNIVGSRPCVDPVTGDVYTN